jgi:hypothetical protein
MQKTSRFRHHNMASSLEVFRLKHQDIEKGRKHVITLLNEKTATKKDTILRDHKVAAALDAISREAQELIDLYEDKDKYVEYI